MLALLPEDGTPVLNRVMRTMLSRALLRPIEPELYFAARDIRLKARRVGRLRGQGGQVFFETKPGPAKQDGSETEAKEAWAEHELKTPLLSYLQGPFRKGLDLPEDAVWFAHDTASLGPHRGNGRVRTTSW
jgi:hypothetical protein